MKDFLFSLSFRGAFVISVALGLVYHFTLFDDGSSIEQKISMIKKEQISKKEENKRLNKENNIFKELLRNKEQLGKQFQRLIGYIPEKDTASSYTKLLANQAKLSNVDILSLDKQKEIVSKDGLYTTLPFKIKLRGTYSSIVLFLSYLTKVNRIINIGSFEINAIVDPKDKTKKITTCTGDILTYKYNPEKEELLKQEKQKGA